MKYCRMRADVVSITVAIASDPIPPHAPCYSFTYSSLSYRSHRPVHNLSPHALTHTHSPRPPPPPQDCYTPRPIPSVSDHVTFQRDLCDDLGLRGRIRVSPEGVNGVLSGRVGSLRSYERSVRMELPRRCVTTGAANAADAGDGVGGDGDGDRDDGEGEGDIGSLVDLDVKYCRMRADVPVETQEFDSLSVKATREVVSLYELGPEEQREMAMDRGNGSRNRGRRRRRRGGRKAGNPPDAAPPLPNGGDDAATAGGPGGGKDHGDGGGSRCRRRPDANPTGRD